MSKLRKGDTVIVIAGKDKGKQGTVQAVKNDRIKVEGINIVTKHQKPNQATGVEGGILKQEAFLHISNVAILMRKPKKLIVLLISSAKTARNNASIVRTVK